MHHCCSNTADYNARHTNERSQKTHNTAPMWLPGHAVPCKKHTAFLGWGFNTHLFAKQPKEEAQACNKGIVGLLLRALSVLASLYLFLPRVFSTQILWHVKKASRKSRDLFLPDCRMPLLQTRVLCLITPRPCAHAKELAVHKNSGGGEVGWVHLP